MIDTSSDSMQKALDFWLSGDLYKYTRSSIGDISHIVSTENVYVVRGWLLHLSKPTYSIELGFETSWARPAFDGDVRTDVLEVFPSKPEARNSGVVFILPRNAPIVGSLQLFWRITDENGEIIKIVNARTLPVIEESAIRLLD